MTIIHEPKYIRDQFPLPVKRMKVSDDGTTTQQYRPIAILEFINEQLLNASQAKMSTERHAKKKLEELI